MVRIPLPPGYILDTFLHRSEYDGQKILMLVGDYARRLRDHGAVSGTKMIGHQVDAVCPDKIKGDYIMTAIHDFDGAQTTARNPATALFNADFASAKEAEIMTRC